MPVTATRRTGLIAKVVNPHSNDWEDFAGLDINIPAVYQPIDTTEGDWDHEHWSYRGQAAMCQLADGSIVRVRIGDWTNTSERRIQRQIITDPTDPSQWQVWNWLAYDDAYAVAIERDDAAAAGYRIYHSKITGDGLTEGLYMDNVRIVSGAAGGMKCVKIKPVYGDTNRIYFMTVSQASDGYRQVDWWYVDNTTAGGLQSFRRDAAQFQQYHHDLFTAKFSVYVQRFRAMPLGGTERDQFASDTLTVETGSYSGTTFEFSEFNKYQFVRNLKGPSARAGFKRIDNLYLTKIANQQFTAGAWYLFYTEQHMDSLGNVMSNLKNPLFWSRSVPGNNFPHYFTQPVPVGYSIWGFAGAVVSGDYVYIAGNGRVLRSLLNPTETDITNYIIEGSYELPRDNGKAVGRLLCANPRNVLGEVFEMTSNTEVASLTERRLKFGIGYKRPHDNGFVYKRAANWWISGLRKLRAEDGKEQIEIEISDFWHRLENPFRDTWSIPGKFDWSDWQPEAANLLSNYTNDTDEFTSYNPAGAPESTVPRLRATASGTGPLGGTITLFTGYRDINGFVSATLWSPGGLVFRYVDAENFYYVEITASGTYVHRVTDGDDNVIGSSTHDSAKFVSNPDGSYLEVRFGWNQTEVYVAGGGTGQAVVFQITFPAIYAPQPWNGFVGMYAPGQIEVSNFIVESPHTQITTRELLKMLLAYAGEHEVQFESDEETLAAPQFDLMLGPQSDLDTPEKAVRQALESSKLNIVWRQD